MIEQDDTAPDTAQDNMADGVIHEDAAYDVITEAAAEYRASGAYNNLTNPGIQHHERANHRIKTREAQQFRFSQTDGAGVWDARLRAGNFNAPGAASEKTARIIDAIRQKSPDAFNYGARCGYYATTHDPELFKHWTARERDAFFAGYNYGRVQRLQMASIKEAAE